METFTIGIGLIRDLVSVWAPLFVPVAVAFFAGWRIPIMVRTARSNAQIRAQRAARQQRVVLHPSGHAA